MKLKTKLIELDDYKTIQQFRCDNKSIEDFLKQDAYYLTIAKECSTTLVFDSNELIGFFSLKQSTFQIEINGQINDFPCLDIARIATSTKKQNLGYGSAIIKKIYEVASHCK